MAFHYFVDPAFRNFGIVVYNDVSKTFVEALHIAPSAEYDMKRKASVTAADIFHLQELTRQLMALRERFPVVAVHVETPAGSRSGRASKLLASVLSVLVTWTCTLDIKMYLYSRAEAKKGILGISGTSGLNKGKFSKSALKKLVKEKVMAHWSQLKTICTLRNQGEAEHICDACALFFAARMRGIL